MLDWFDSNRRDFPWRDESTSNYEIIISEVLLQRTKAETVAKFYPNFFGKYPGWISLSRATLEEFEQILKPLGLYKQRAKRLYKIASEFKLRNGELPANKNELQESSMASLYIANAYELFVFKKRKPLLDVNMSRLLNRYFNNEAGKDLRIDIVMQELANKVVNVRKTKELNWAILDFGALICTAINPKCDSCVLSKKCGFFNKVRITDGNK